MREGFSTNRPPYFEGADFQYWKGRMEYYLKTDIAMWFSVKEGYTPPRDEEGKELESSRWSTEQLRKAQADAKAMVTLQCGIAKDQLVKVGPFTSARDLWNKLIELQEGTRDSRIAKRDLFLNQLQNLTMKENENVSELHGRFKEIINGLHSIDEHVENRDLVRYVLKAFPRNALWSSMVDAYKVSKDLSIVKLDEFFCEMELHELANKGQKEKGIALVAGERSKDGRRKKEKKKEKEISSSTSSSESDDEGESSSSSEMANFVRRIMRRSRRYKGKPNDPNIDKSNVTCYECSKKGHYRSECPKLKKEERAKKKEERAKKKEERSKKKKALKATWDESSSSSSEEEEKKEKSTRHLALMAREDSGSDGNSSDASNAASSSSDDEEVTSSHVEKCYKTITHLSTLLKKSKTENKLLKEEVEMLKALREDEVDDLHLELLEDENKALKSEVEKLKKMLEKFSTSSKTLDMILNAQRAVYNKAGIGYQPKESSFISLVSRTQYHRSNDSRVHGTRKGMTKAWVPRSLLVDALGPKIWVPKTSIFRIL